MFLFIIVIRLASQKKSENLYSKYFLIHVLILIQNIVYSNNNIHDSNKQ